MAVSDFFKKYFGETSVANPSNILSGVKKTGSSILSGLKTTGQSALRTYATVTPAIYELGAKPLGTLFPSTKSQLKANKPTLTPSTYFQKELYGTDKPITASSVGSEVGVSEKSKFAAPLGIALGVSDLIPGGKVTKSTAVGFLKNANKVDDAFKALKQMMGVADDVAKKYAPKFAVMTDAKHISTMVDDVIKESQDVGRMLSKGKEVVKNIFKGGDLAQEAQKYKSAEEFVKAQPTVYHGTLEKFDNFDNTKAGSNTEWANAKFGTFFLDDMKTAKEFPELARMTGDNRPVNVKEVVIDLKNPIDLSLEGIFTNEKQAPTIIKILGTEDGKPITNPKKALEYLNDNIDLGDIGDLKDALYGDIKNKKIMQDAGYDGIISDYGDGIKEKVVFDTNQIKTKSQLTDIWNKAKEIVPEVSEKERKFITSVKEALPKLEGKVAGQYIPRSTDELAIKAKNFILDDIVGAERIAREGTGEEAVAIASELIKKYGDDAAKAIDPAQANMLYDKAADIANTLAPKLTEQGRAIQAASILGRLTPEGQLRFAARQIQAYNEANPLKRIPELAGEQAKYIIDEMKEIGTMADGLDKAKRFQKLQDYVKTLVPTPLMKKITTVWKAGLLTGIKTSGLNLFSNLSHSATEVIKDVPAAIVDSVASLFTGQRTKTATLKGSGKGVAEGFQKGVEYFKTGFDERNIATKLDYTKVNFGKGKVAKVFQTYTDTVFRVLGSSDQPFYYGAVARSLADQAKAKAINAGLKGKQAVEFIENLIQSPTEEMIKYATADGATAVFQNETYLGKAAKALQNIPVVGEILVPFGRTPSAVATQIINYSPVGIVKTIVSNIGKGKFDQRLFSEGIGRGITGTVVLYIGTELAKKGLVTLDRPSTEREQKLWELEGRKPNSIKIGDKWRSITVLGPAGNLLLVGAHFNKAFEESGSPTEALTKTMLGAAKSFTEQTFLTGINSAVQAIADPERSAANYIGNMVSSVVPTLVSDVARATDPLERRTETIPERLQARIPGLRNNLEPQVDTLGNERKTPGNPLEILLDPTRPQKDISTPVIKELRRLTDLGYEVSPTLIGDKKGFKALTPAQNTELWKRTGEVLNGKLEGLFTKEEYKSASNEARGKIVEKFIDKVKVITRAEMAIKLTEGLQGEELKTKLKELIAGGLVTKEVFRKFEELR